MQCRHVCAYMGMRLYIWAVSDARACVYTPLCMHMAVVIVFVSVCNEIYILSYLMSMTTLISMSTPISMSRLL